MPPFIKRFSFMQAMMVLSALLVSLVSLQFLLSDKHTLRGESSAKEETLRQSEYLMTSVTHGIIKLRLDMKEYMMVQDEKYIVAFDGEVTKLSTALEKLAKEPLINSNATMKNGLEVLRQDLKATDQAFKKVAALVRENNLIEATVFAKYNTLLEEHPNKILFQSFQDNDPMSGNSAAYLLDSLLKYKISVASYILHNSEFFLIRSNELKGEIDKHAHKIEAIVDNKESLKRIKNFKEAFVLYAQGFDTLAQNTQVKSGLLAKCFDEMVPRMLQNTQQLQLISQGPLTQNSFFDEVLMSRFFWIFTSVLSFFVGLVFASSSRAKSSNLL